MPSHPHVCAESAFVNSASIYQLIHPPTRGAHITTWIQTLQSSSHSIEFARSTALSSPHLVKLPRSLPRIVYGRVGVVYVKIGSQDTVTSTYSCLERFSLSRKGRHCRSETLCAGLREDTSLQLFTSRASVTRVLRRFSAFGRWATLSDVPMTPSASRIQALSGVTYVEIANDACLTPLIRVRALAHRWNGRRHRSRAQNIQQHFSGFPEVL
ncbi:hypothetical protein FKP32DRAFT_877458 [Trametes sanguinea]|nr:hypothetical protein FKP32DRAFT_877458 [Trametes sanguinea]